MFKKLFKHIVIDGDKTMIRKIKKILIGIYHTLKGDSLAVMKRRGLTVGKGFFLGRGSIDGDFLHLISIGDDVTLAGYGVTILAHDASTKHFLNYTKIGKVVIGNRVFIGSGSIILPGVTIGDDVVIGAGSVVSNDIPSHSVAKGNPARVTGTIEEFLKTKQKEMQFYPIFGKEYMIEHNVNIHRKNEMKTKINNKFGYII
jgi:maltose O-acetyltransferase